MNFYLYLSFLLKRSLFLRTFNFLFVAATVYSDVLNYVVLYIAKQKSINRIYLKGDLTRRKGTEKRIMKLIAKAYYLYFNFQTQ